MNKNKGRKLKLKYDSYSNMPIVFRRLNTIIFLRLIDKFDPTFCFKLEKKFNLPFESFRNLNNS